MFTEAIDPFQYHKIDYWYSWDYFTRKIIFNKKINNGVQIWTGPVCLLLKNQIKPFIIAASDIIFVVLLIRVLSRFFC